MVFIPFHANMGTTADGDAKGDQYLKHKRCGICLRLRLDDARDGADQPLIGLLRQGVWPLIGRNCVFR